jgi:hypothetical protein
LDWLELVSFGEVCWATRLPEEQGRGRKGWTTSPTIHDIPDNDFFRKMLPFGSPVLVARVPEKDMFVMTGAHADRSDFISRQGGNSIN